jgi:hypothetical protein
MQVAAVVEMQAVDVATTGEMPTFVATFAPFLSIVAAVDQMGNQTWILIVNANEAFLFTIGALLLGIWSDILVF